MVHHDLDTLGMGILIECLDVEVGIRGQEVEHFLLHIAAPVFPSDIPSLDQHLVEAMLCGKVDVAAHVGIVG